MPYKTIDLTLYFVNKVLDGVVHTAFAKNNVLHCPITLPLHYLTATFDKVAQFFHQPKLKNVSKACVIGHLLWNVAGVN